MFYKLLLFQLMLSWSTCTSLPYGNRLSMSQTVQEDKDRLKRLWADALSL